KRKISLKVLLVIVIPSVIIVLSIIIILYFCIKRRKKVLERKIEVISFFLIYLSIYLYKKIQSVDSLHIKFTTISTATCNFSDANKLGRGGFGIVYK
ncbi:hypothetical protein MKW98_005943, partial [Papaver atlanticum]